MLRRDIYSMNLHVDAYEKKKVQLNIPLELMLNQMKINNNNTSQEN
jgi:hypothetical protein